jgi:hypothetical protein
MPNNSFGHANAGFAALAAGDHLRANEHFRESLRLDPHFDLGRRGLLQSLRARIWLIRFHNRVSARLGNRNLRLCLVGIGILALFISSATQGPPATAGSDPNDGKFSVGGAVILFLMGYIYFLGLVILLANFLLIFDPMGRHALSGKEKRIAWLCALAFFGAVAALLLAHLWLVAAVCLAGFLLLAVSVYSPLLKDRWERSREREAAES